MKRLTKFTVLFFLLLITANSVLFAQTVKFSTNDIYNKKVTDAVFKDAELTMINIWGTFCGPCIIEMPDLGKLSEDYAGKKFQIVGIVIDAVNRKNAPLPKIVETAKMIVDQTNANYIHIIPTSELMNGILKDVYAVPTTIFVDKNGKIVGQTYTGSRSYSDWARIVDSLLK